MSVIELGGNDFDATVTTNPLVVVDCWASWCGPCRAFAPVFARSAQAHPEVVHAKVDTEAEPELASTLGIQAIPTVLAFRDGVLVHRQPGALPAGALESLVEQLKSLDMDAIRAELAARARSAS